jgi:flagellin-like protein
MIKNNKGMSEIITTLIIIALALAALGVVWYVINNVLSSSKSEVETGTENIFQTCAEAGGTVVNETATCTEGNSKQIVGGQYCCVPTA